MAVFNELELDCLKEFMNIGVGKSARSLAELFGRRVGLSVPQVMELDPGTLGVFLRDYGGTASCYEAAGQDFFGPLQGQGFFFLNRSEALSIASVIGLELDMADGIITDLVEELSNLVLVSCVGFMADALKGSCSFSAPHYLGCETNLTGVTEQGDVRLGLKTVFSFGPGNADGHLVLTVRGSSLPWLKSALDTHLAGLSC
ncbi:MAG: chemotaxis protein CheC [Spirochaetia bacterium]|nr:chemotaxis protein CheC [Spirochaetia bacterium]